MYTNVFDLGIGPIESEKKRTYIEGCNQLRSSKTRFDFWLPFGTMVEEMKPKK
jgi:hypothetical protein